MTNWTFQTKWNAQNPGILATASFDGKISIQTIQSTRNISTESAPSKALDGEDFFKQAQSQPQVASFSLQKPPKWLQRPCGASFGFGGKIVCFETPQAEGTGPKKSTISLSTFTVDNDIRTMTEAFAKTMSERNLKDICETRIGNAASESEKTDWRVIETLIANNPRKELINYLGMSTPNEPDDVSGRVNGQSVTNAGEGTHDTSASNKNRLPAFFETGQDGENFLADLASTKGAKTNNPFHIYSEAEPEAEKRITKALLLGNFERAMDICLAEDHLSDAFMIAICGGQVCMEKVQKAYFKKQASGPNYLRLLASIVGKNLWDVVYNADLQNWKEVMATLCTYANAEEFPDLCEALGDRLEDQSMSEVSDHAHKESASFCYIAGSKLEKVVGVWIAELDHNERQGLQDSSDNSSFSIHARSLQNFIEKVTVFREVTRYQDKERVAQGNWKLAALYEKYLEYADIVASHGQLQTSETYLNLLPDKYPAAEVARNRVRQAIKKSATAQPTKQPSVMNATFAPIRPVFEETKPPQAQPSRPYAPQNPQSSDSYIPQNPASYAGQNYQPLQPPAQAPPGRPIIPPPPSFGVPNQGPPRGSSASPAVPPPSKAPSMSNWNDTPEEFSRPLNSRRGTPAAVPQIPNHYSNQPFPSSTPPVAGQQPLVLQKTTPAPPPPPPKGPAPPPRTQTPQMNQTYQPPPLERPPSATNVYAPPPNYMPSQQQVPPSMGSSPYNPPPPGTQPQPGKYAPTSTIPQNPTPPAQASSYPPPNPYAPPQRFSGPLDSGQGGHLQGPPRAAPPLGGAQEVQGQSAAQPPRASKPQTPKHRK